MGGLLAAAHDRRSSLRETFAAGEMVLAPGQTPPLSCERLRELEQRFAEG
jgi:hypothetical protein